MSLPRPVWVHPSPGRVTTPRIGLLLEWKREPDARGVQQWYGLVASASGGGDRPWGVSMEWVWAVHLEPMDVSPPGGVV